MANVIRISGPSGWSTDPETRRMTTHTTSCPKSTREEAPAPTDLNDRVAAAFRANFIDSVPSLEGLVVWLVNTEFRSAFLENHALSKEEQCNTLQGILRTIQGDQPSIESTLSLEGRAVEFGEENKDATTFRVAYDMIHNGYNGLRCYTKVALADLDIKSEAKRLYKMIHQEKPVDGPVGENTLDHGAFIHETKDSCISSLLRAAHGLSCGRRMKLEGAGKPMRTICYAGRPDTDYKLKELITMIFRTELKEGRLDLTETQRKGEEPIDLSVVINSLISTFSKQDIHLDGEMTEYELLQREIDLLKNWQGREIEIDGFRVKPNIKLYYGNFNFVNALERALPDSISGRLRGQLISDSVDDLRKLIPTGQLNNRISEALNKLELGIEDGTLKSEEKLFLRILICKEAGLPTVFHCRSCVDRTTIAAAMVYDLNQWTDLGLDIPENPLKLVDTEEFKELFWGHIAHAINISSYSRKEGGYKWQTTPFKWFTQHPTVLRLMPQRLLQKFNFFDLSIKELCDFFVEKKATKSGGMKIRPTPKYLVMLPFFIAVSMYRKVLSVKENGAVENAKLLYRVPIGIACGILALALETVLYTAGFIGGLCIQAQNKKLVKDTNEMEMSLLAEGKKEGVSLLQREIATRGLKDATPHLLGLSLMLLPFSVIPSHILLKGVYIEGADKKQPAIFGDTPRVAPVVSKAATRPLFSN